MKTQRLRELIQILCIPWVAKLHVHLTLRVKISHRRQEEALELLTLSLPQEVPKATTLRFSSLTS